MNDFDRICSFCGQIFTLSVKEDRTKGGTAVDVILKKFDPQGNLFFVTCHRTSAISSCCLRVYATGSCVDSRFGVYKLHVLLGSSTDSRFFICSVDGISNFKTVGNYRFSIKPDQNCGKFLLFDGPGACCCLENKKIVIFYAGSVQVFPTEEKFVLLDCCAVENYLIIIGTTYYRNGQKETLLTLCYSLTCLKSVDKFSCRLIPDVYSDVVTCVSITHLEVSSEDALQDRQFHRTALACTSYGQLIECRDGLLSTCILLPFKDGCSIHRVPMSSGRSQHLVVQSAAKSCCVLDLEASQVVFVLEDVENVFVDDFIGRGLDQILFLPNQHQMAKDVVSMIDESAANNVNAKFLLTDFAGNHVDNWTTTKTAWVQTVDETSKSNSVSGHQVTIEALESRVLVGQAMVSEAHRLCLRKLAVIEESCAAVNQMILGTTLAPRTKYALVPLIGVRKRDEASGRSQVKSQRTEGVTTGALWQRILDRKFIIGLPVHNNKSRPIHFPQLSFTVSGCTSGCNPCVTTYSQCLRVNLSPFQATNPQKQPKLEESGFGKYVVSTFVEDLESIPPNTSADVIAYSDLPLFLPGESKTFNLTLTWKEQVESSGLLMVWCSRVAGRVLLDVEDVVKGTWRTSFMESSRRPSEEESREEANKSNDLLALHSIQMGHRISLSSAHAQLPDILSLLKSLKFLFHKQHHCFLCLDSNSTLFLTRISVLEACYSDLTLHLFVRDLSQWTILLQSLFKFLPYDVSVVSGNQSKATHLAESVLLSLKREVISKDSREPVPASECSRDTDETATTLCVVGDVRRDFGSRRKRYAEKVTSEAADGVNIGGCMELAEQTTDRLVVQLAELV